MMGIYEALWALNVPVEFLHVDDVISSSSIDFDLVFVPFALALNSSVSAALARFVEKGGRIVAEARTAWTDEKGNTGA